MLNGIDNTYLINLPKDTLRLEQSLIETKKYGINPIIIEGINPSNIPSGLLKYTNPIYNNFVPRGALGCALAHISAWESIVKNDDNFALIIEDDIQFVDDFSDKFNEIFPTVPKDISILYLGCHNCDNNKKYDDSLSSIFLFPYKKKVIQINNNVYTPSIPLATHSYILTKKSAQFLLDYFKENKVKFHVDAQLLEAIYNIPSYAINPKLTAQKEMNTSTSNNTSNNYPIFVNNFLEKFKNSDNVPLSYKLTFPIMEIMGFPINTYFFLFLLFGFISGVKNVNFNTLNLGYIIFNSIEFFYETNNVLFIKNIVVLYIVSIIGFYIGKKFN
jgi:GR25 family glycosyltransferase involved in LPS biosynthesis